MVVANCPFPAQPDSTRLSDKDSFPPQLMTPTKDNPDVNKVQYRCIGISEDGQSDIDRFNDTEIYCKIKKKQTTILMPTIVHLLGDITMSEHRTSYKIELLNSSYSNL